MTYPTMEQVPAWDWSDIEKAAFLHAGASSEQSYSSTTVDSNIDPRLYTM